MKKFYALLMTLCLAALLSACGSEKAPKESEKVETKEETQTTEVSTKAPETAPTATEAAQTETQAVVNAIDLIEMGMTYEEVVTALGIEGALASETKAAGATVAVWQWNYNDGSGYIAVTTQDGIVTAKNDIRYTTATSDITLELYGKITIGMTYEEVVELIGSEGSLLSDSNLAGIQSTMYMWKSSDGLGVASIMFQDNKVVSGSQTGLK